METMPNQDRSQVEVETSGVLSDAPRDTERHNRPSQAPAASRSSNSPDSPPEAATDPVQPRDGVQADPAEAAHRPWTPDRANADGSTTLVLKRACNGCGTRLGHVTDQEMARAINGLPLPDVRKECPTCGPTAPEPRCLPVKTVHGDPDCLDQDCDHDTAPGSDYCDEVTEHAICATHSEINTDGAITRPASWPCTHTTQEMTR